MSDGIALVTLAVNISAVVWLGKSLLTAGFVGSRLFEPHDLAARNPPAGRMEREFHAVRRNVYADARPLCRKNARARRDVREAAGSFRPVDRRAWYSKVKRRLPLGHAQTATHAKSPAPMPSEAAAD